MAKKREFPWDVSLTPKADKAKDKLPGYVQDIIAILIKQMGLLGPYRYDWKNYGPLSGKGIPADVFHCHLKKGKPTYVACWKIANKREREGSRGILCRYTRKRAILGERRRLLVRLPE